MIKKISYERRIYESVDDNSLTKAISQKLTKKNKSCNNGLLLDKINEAIILEKAYPKRTATTQDKCFRIIRCAFFRLFFYQLGNNLNIGMPHESYDSQVRYHKYE